MCLASIGESVYNSVAAHYLKFKRSYFGIVSQVFVTAPRTSLAGMQSTVTALPCTDYKAEEPD